MDDSTNEKKGENASKVAIPVIGNPVTDAPQNIEMLSSSICCLTLRTVCREENPLQNPVILQHFFQLCPASIMALCRLVCKQWYDESLLNWRTSFPLTITERNMDIFRDKPGDQPRSNRNIRLRRYPFESRANDFGAFWKAIGSNLTTLDLSRCSFLTRKEFRQIIYNSCPNLEKLDIVRCTFPTRRASSRDNELEYKEPHYGKRKHNRLKSLYVHLSSKSVGDAIPISWLELFSHFPSLTSFECRVSSGNQFPESEFESLIDAIRIIRRNSKRLLPFKHFQLYPNLAISRDLDYHYRFDLIKELRLPLKGCCIEVNAKIDVSSITSTLEYLAPSVNSVTLYREKIDRRGNHVIFPTLTSFRSFPFGIRWDNLTRLESRGDLIGSFRLLKYTPNLSKLEISYTYSDYHDHPVGMGRKAISSISNSCKRELANLQMMRLLEFSLGFRVKDDDIQHFNKWMPNITNLEMVLNDKQFDMVCQNWENLRELTVYGDEGDGLLTENGLTGKEKGKRRTHSPCPISNSGRGTEESKSVGLSLKVPVETLETLREAHSHS